MCGIVGYAGSRQAASVLLDGLEKLEYRGYDSAGVCVHHDGALNTVKAKGRLSVLRDRLEGGDVLVYHNKIFVGNSGYGSNSAGIEWLRKYLAPYGYEVEEVKLQGHILHLDCVMSLVREGLMIVCEESLADGVPETFRDWDRIPVPEDDAERLAVNGMAINPDVYITDIAFRDTIGKELEARGVKVEYLDFFATRCSAGSIHCSTQPLKRVDSE